MLVPKLRFKREDGTEYPEWDKKTIGKYARIYDGVHQTPNYIESGVPFVSVEDIESLDTPTKFISAEDYERDFKTKPKIGDILMTRIGDVGRTAIVPCDGYAYYVSLALIKPFASVSNKFLCQAMKGDFFQRELWEHTIHTAFPKKINAGDIQHCEISIPSDLEEQQKIADFLSTVDEVITQSEAEVQNLAQQKKAAMQKIFSQEVRFKREDGTEYPNWERKKFGTTVLIERGGSPRPIKQYITNGKGLNWVKIGDAPEYGRYITHTAEKIKESGLNKTRQVFKGDLILSNSMSFGKPYIMAIDGCIHDGWLLIRNNQNVYNLVYLCYLLGTEYMLKQYKSLAGGSTVNNLNKDLVSMTTVSIPCLEEQQKIANFLSAYDEAITCAKQELEHWKQLKKGLLQQMFV